MRAKHDLGSAECKEGNRLFCMLNMSVEESKRLATALKVLPPNPIESLLNPYSIESLLNPY